MSLCNRILFLHLDFLRKKMQRSLLLPLILKGKVKVALADIDIKSSIYVHLQQYFCSVSAAHKSRTPQSILSWSFLCFYSKNLQRVSQHDYYRFYFSERCHWLFSFSALSACLTGCADMSFYRSLGTAVSHAQPTNKQE